MTFLQQITSRAGKNLITGPHKTKVHSNGSPMWVEKWVDFENEQDTDLAIKAVEQTCKGTYFALGAFNPDEKGKRSRKAVNCVALRSFWFDVDCGEAKWQKHNGVGCYRTREDGMMALSAFISASGMPPPTYIVSSGEGFHIYWVLDQDLPIADWRAIALDIKSLLVYYDFKADPARTADASSVLRVPGTHHSNGSLVTIMASHHVVPVANIKAWLDSQRPFINSPQHREKLNALAGLGERPDYIDASAESTLDEQELNTPKKFENIIKRSELDGTGCPQLYDLYMNQQTVPEPRCSAALSIANFCEDGEAWAIKISENHAEFDPALTIKKMEQWNAPRTCSWFLDNYPDHCKGCPLAVGAKSNPNQSPIRLALDDNRVPTVVTDVIAGDNADGYTEEFIIPSYPFPYWRDPKLGGVWTNGDEGPELIYDFDLYVCDRIGLGYDGKPRFWLRQHTPHDGVCEIELSSDDLYAGGASFQQKMAGHNILIPPDRQANAVAKYLKQSVSSLQRNRAMLKPARQLGWTDKDSFILGSGGR